MRLKVALIGKELYGAVGALERPDTGETAEIQETEKAKALILIVNALGDMPPRAFMDEGADCPRKMWRQLEHLYASKTETAHLTVATNIANKKLRSGGNIKIYMAELDALYDRLESMGEVTSDRTKVAKLPASVPDEYSSISADLRTQVKDERTWNEVQDLMLDEYERLDQPRGTKGRRSSGPGSKVLYTREQRRNVICQNCKKKGHIRKYCKEKKAEDEPAKSDSNSNGEGSRERDPDRGSRSSARKASSNTVKLLMARSGSYYDGPEICFGLWCPQAHVSHIQATLQCEKGAEARNLYCERAAAGRRVSWRPTADFECPKWRYYPCENLWRFSGPRIV